MTSQGIYYPSDPETELKRLCCTLEGVSATRARRGNITAQEITSLVSNKRSLRKPPWWVEAAPDLFTLKSNSLSHDTELLQTWEWSAKKEKASSWGLCWFHFVRCPSCDVIWRRILIFRWFIPAVMTVKCVCVCVCVSERVSERESVREWVWVSECVCVCVCVASCTWPSTHQP